MHKNRDKDSKKDNALKQNKLTKEGNYKPKSYGNGFYNYGDAEYAEESQAQ
jgi:hypothetical protein